MSATAGRRQPILPRLYWAFHFLATWVAGIGLLAAGTLLTELSGSPAWSLFALGIGALLLGEISRRNRRVISRGFSTFES